MAVTYMTSQVGLDHDGITVGGVKDEYYVGDSTNVW